MVGQRLRRSAARRSRASVRTLCLTGLVAGATLVAAGPAQAGFYDPPSGWEDASRGDVLRKQNATLDAEVVSPDAHVKRIMYRSKGAEGQPVVETGVVVWPDGPAPAGGRRVIAWGHGTLGIGDSCAPSKYPTLYPGTWKGYLRAVNRLVKAGYVVVAPDYEGLGTPGLHTWLHAASSGRSMLDGVVAARQVADAAGLETTRRFATIGQSQGATAAISAGEQDAPKSLGQDLKQVGSVAWGYLDNYYGLMEGEFASETPNPGAYPYVAYIALGVEAQYPGFDHARLVGPGILPYMTDMQGFDACWDGWFGLFGALDPQPTRSDIWAAGWQSVPEVRQWARRFDIGRRPSDAPVLISNGDLDPYVAFVPDAIDRMCSYGTVVDEHVEVGAGHDDVIPKSWPEVRDWLADRFDGVPSPTVCD